MRTENSKTRVHNH